MKKLILSISVLVVGTMAYAADKTAKPIADINPPTVATEAEGLAAFQRIYEVASHPRCANCHDGAVSYTHLTLPTKA